MQFLFPGFFIALLTLAVPVIIHLFYFRRYKKVYFTNVHFLKEVEQEQNSRRKLRNLLVLASRLLALFFLILAFVQPYLASEKVDQVGPKSVSIYIDNSYSMGSLGQDVPLLEEARKRAREIVNAYGVDDRFQILSNDFEGRQQRLVGQEEALQLIEDIQPTPAVRSLSQVLSRQKQILYTGKNQEKAAFLLSDFQKTITDLQNWKDTTLDITLIPLASVEQRNVAIDSAWFESPVQVMNQTAQLVVKLRNYSDQDADAVRLSLKMDGQDKPVGSISVKAGATQTDTVAITALKPGWSKGTLRIEDYPVQFDDNYHFTFNVPAEIPVLVINDQGSNRYLATALQSAGIIRVTEFPASNINYGAFKNARLIILSDLKSVSSGLATELAQYLRAGGNVLAFPGAGADLNAWNNFLRSLQAADLGPWQTIARQTTDLNTQEFVFRDVYENKNSNLKLPGTKANYQVNGTGSRGGERLISYRDGGVFLSKNRVDKGLMYLCTAPMDAAYSDLTRQAEVFVPMLFRMAISQGVQSKIAYHLGKDEVVEVAHTGGTSERLYKLKGGQNEIIPTQRINGPKVSMDISRMIQQDGIYDLYLQPDSVLSRLAFNFDRRESDLSAFSAKELEEMRLGNIKILSDQSLASLTPLLAEKEKGVALWRWSVILALLFLLTEIALLRFWKV